MLEQKHAAPGDITPLADWTFSPDPRLEAAIEAVRLSHAPQLPAGLGRFLKFLGRLGNPHLALPPVFHVAGTNGKGSSLAFVQAILEAGGHGIHKFTSPHLVRFEERITVAGRMIGAAALLPLIDECRAAAAGEEISFFEFFTALAFLQFSRVPADAVLLETGLGGTFDATNVLPAATVMLTRISYDHMRILGNTLPEIAENKAGIIKPGCPVIVAPQPDPAVEALFAKRAAEKSAPLFQGGRDWRVEETVDGFAYRDARHAFRLPRPALIGQHQLVNAGTAMAAVAQSPFIACLTQDNLAAAMRRVEWPGRLQRLTAGRLAALLPAGWELWLDGAHNDSGADVLLEQAKTWGPEKPLHLITGFKRKKEPDSFYDRLAALPETITAVDAEIDAPMVSAEELCGFLSAAGFRNVRAAKSLEEAIRSLTFQFRQPQRIIITGSLYLVGHALKTNNAEA